MQKIEFKNLPNTDTPITAENLNAIQDNVENEINDSSVVVSATEPTGVERKKVWMQRSDTDNKIYVKNDNDVYEEFISKEKILKIERDNNIFIAQSGYTFSDTNIFNQGNHYFGYIVIKKNSGNFSNTQDLVAKLSKNVKGVYNNGCFLSNDLWKATSVGYCYIGSNNVYVADHENKGLNYAKIHVDLVVDE